MEETKLRNIRKTNKTHRPGRIHPRSHPKPTHTTTRQKRILLFYTTIPASVEGNSIDALILNPYFQNDWPIPAFYQWYSADLKTMSAYFTSRIKSNQNENGEGTVWCGCFRNHQASTKSFETRVNTPKSTPEKTAPKFFSSQMEPPSSNASGCTQLSLNPNAISPLANVLQTDLKIQFF